MDKFNCNLSCFVNLHDAKQPLWKLALQFDDWTVYYKCCDNDDDQDAGLDHDNDNDRL